MAKKLHSVPSTVVPAGLSKPKGAPASYWQTLNETLTLEDEIESLAPKVVHGLRRESIRRKI